MDEVSCEYFQDLVTFQSDLGLSMLNERKEHRFEVGMGDQVCEQVDMRLVEERQ